MNQKNVAIIGAGRVGGAVGYLLSRAGYTITAAARTAGSAQKAAAFIGAKRSETDVSNAARAADIIFITTPDGAIKDTCRILAKSGAIKPGALVIHMSGAHSLDLLESAGEVGALRAVIHPLQSVPSMELGVKNIPGSYFRIEADSSGIDICREIVKALGGIELRMPGWVSDRHSAALYHAGAVAVSNFFVSLIHYGLRFYISLGAERDVALKAVLPLIKGTLKNIEEAGIPSALTGPIMRGDIETVIGHIDAMKQRAPELLPLYLALARETVEVATERGLPKEKAEEMLRLLDDACNL